MISLLFVGCFNSVEYSETFKKETSGKYLYNANEIIEIDFNNNDVIVIWRGGKIETISLDQNAFFVKEMNKKLRFVQHPQTQKRYLSVISEDNDALTYDYLKMPDDYNTPSMYLKAGNYEKALQGFLEIKQQDSLSPFLNEWDFNRLGYNYLRDNDYDNAISVFKINTKLHPESDNVYDSLADAYLRSGDSLQAYNNYKKALKYNTGNRKAKKFIQAYEAKQ